MGRFGGLGSVSTNQGGLYFLQGDYDVEIDEVVLKQNRKKQDCFIVSGKVLTSTNADRAPGCKPAQVIVFKEEYLETIMGNVKQFAGAMLEIEDPDSYVADVDPSIPGDTPEAATDRFWESALDMFVSPEQPLKGMNVHLNVVEVPTKSGGTFSKHCWGPVLKEPVQAPA